jgi:hypothetical protein
MHAMQHGTQHKSKAQQRLKKYWFAFQNISGA